MMCFAQILEVQQAVNENRKPVLKSQLKTLERFAQNPKTLTPETERHLRRVFTIFKKLLETSPDTFSGKHFRVSKGFATVSFCPLSRVIKH